MQGVKADEGRAFFLEEAKISKEIQAGKALLAKVISHFLLLLDDD